MDFSILLPFVCLRGIIRLEPHLQPHAKTELVVHGLQILIHAYDELACPKQTKAHSCQQS